MSLKDALDTARAQAERERQEAERAEAAARRRRRELAARAGEAIRSEAAEIYRSVCDRIAGAIYAGEGEPRACAEGYIELPGALCLPAGGGGASLPLVETRREELFWGYRKHLELTRHGAMLVDAVRQLAAADGVSICAAVMERAPGCAPRFIELSRSTGSARCTGRDGIECKLALRYSYEWAKPEERGGERDGE